VGNTTTATDAAGRWKKYTNDALGQLVQVTEPNPAGGAAYETYYTYNVAGQMTQVSMPRPNVGLPGTTTQVRTWVYDANGYLTSTTQPENGATTYAYNGNGLLAHKIDAKGQKVVFTYDGFNRVTKVEPFATAGASTPIPCEVVENTYDVGVNGLGRMGAQSWGAKDLTVCAKGLHKYEFAYTSLGKVTQKRLTLTQTRANPLQGNQMQDFAADLSVGYEYNALAQMTKVVYPNSYAVGNDGNGHATLDLVVGHHYSYTYDTMGRPVGATWQVNGAGSVQTMVQGVTYNALGQMTQWQWWEGSFWSTENRTYDALARLTGITAPGVNVSYAYSATADDGKIVSKTDGDGTVQYGYDSLGRLATAATTGPQWGLSYLYDGFGNRLQQNVTKAGAGYAPPSSNLFVDPSTNRVNSWSYDANGNATSIPGVGAVSYDWANRVSGVGGESYGYDPGNKRLWKNSVLTLWSGGRVGTFDLLFAAHWTGSSYVQQLRFRQLSSDRYFAGRKLRGEDRLGSVGSRFNPYGEEIAASANPADQFATYHRDGTGLDYADQRYYHAGSGRFVSSDPYEGSARLDAPESANRFSYAASDPVGKLDPDGAAPIDSAEYLACLLRTPHGSSILDYRTWAQHCFGQLEIESRSQKQLEGDKSPEATRGAGGIRGNARSFERASTRLKRIAERGVNCDDEFMSDMKLLTGGKLSLEALRGLADEVDRRGWLFDALESTEVWDQAKFWYCAS